MTEPESRFYESNRLRLHYAVWGDESKPPLVLQHGSRDQARSWDFVAQRLLDDYSVYAPDMRGHGDSDWLIGAGYSFADHVADLWRLLTVIDRGPVYLVGHSRGGRVVTDFAATFPEHVRKLVNIEGFGRPFLHDEPLQRMRRYAQQTLDVNERRVHAYRSLEEAEARMLEANKRLSPEMVRHLTRHAVRRREDGSYVWKFDNNVRAISAPEWNFEQMLAIFSAVSVPTLFVGGSESYGRMTDPEVAPLIKALRPQRSVVFQEAAHWVHHDQLEGFVALLRDFLAEE